MRSETHSSNLYFRNVVLPWNVIHIGFTDQLQRLRWWSGVFPEIKVFQYAPDDRRLLDEGDDFRIEAAFILSTALRTLQSIDVPDFLEKRRPQLFSTSGT